MVARDRLTRGERVRWRRHEPLRGYQDTKAALRQIDGCMRRGSAVSAYSELVDSADQRRPPIRTIPGD
jgi:hypothetical protein